MKRIVGVDYENRYSSDDCNVEFVRVIRCKNCANSERYIGYCSGKNRLYCKKHNKHPEEDFYCADGEPR